MSKESDFITNAIDYDILRKIIKAAKTDPSITPEQLKRCNKFLKMTLDEYLDNPPTPDNPMWMTTI